MTNELENSDVGVARITMSRPLHEARPAWTQVIDGAADLADTTLGRVITHCVGPHADIKIRDRVVRRERVQQIPPVHRVHAAEYDIALRESADHVGVPEILRQADHVRPELGALDGVAQHIDLEALAWFDRSESQRSEVHEQTIRTDDDEILTLVLIRDPIMLEEWNTSRASYARRR
jgi:hypothetical protein